MSVVDSIYIRSTTALASDNLETSGQVKVDLPFPDHCAATDTCFPGRDSGVREVLLRAHSEGGSAS